MCNFEVVLPIEPIIILFEGSWNIALSFNLFEFAAEPLHFGIYCPVPTAPGK